MDKPTDDEAGDRLARYEKRLQRERAARKAAERLLELKARDLYVANQELKSLASALEERVQERTRELTVAREQAMQLAERDQLTGLANRACFQRLMCEAIEGAREGKRKFALALIDLDRFKAINDTLGHDAGDAFLQHAAAHIKRAIRGHDVAARLGGDEFAVICNFVDGVRDVERIAERIMAEFDRPLQYRGKPLTASCSIGFAMYPDDAGCVSDLQRFADVALYRSKATGRAAFTGFNSALSDEIEQRESLESELRQAVAEGAIVPWYQPIVDGATRKPVAAEVLARWKRRDGSIMPSIKFIHAVERCGMIHEMFRGVLRSSCRDALPWVRAGRIDYISVNLSPVQFKLKTFCNDLERILRETAFPASALQVEVAEAAPLLDIDAMQQRIGELDALGVRVALDRFGSGNTSIRHLRRLPLKCLKLDRSFAAEVTGDVSARTIVSAIADIAMALKMDLVAEGVEAEAQALWLGRAGCRQFQGYLFGRPVDATGFAAELRGDAINATFCA